MHIYVHLLAAYSPFMYSSRTSRRCVNMSLRACVALWAVSEVPSLLVTAALQARAMRICASVDRGRASFIYACCGDGEDVEVLPVSPVVWAAA